MSLHRKADPRHPFFSITFSLILFALATLSQTPKSFGAAPDAPKAPPDVLVFTNGDQLSGTFLHEVGGKVTFHSDMVGDIDIEWSKIKELRTQTKVAVLEKSVTLNPRKPVPASVPQGTVTVAADTVTVHPENNATIPTIPVKNATYIVDQATLTKQMGHEPGFFTGWNGSATAGATIVQATQKQYSFNGALALLRVMPTLSWLNPRNRTTADFTGSYGKITEKSYTSGGVFFPSITTKTALYHADAERDEYFSPRVYVLGQVAFDHNFSQGLDLQQIYGGGIGWTALKRPNQELDLKATVQYERQSFINATDGVNQNLIGSTFAAIYFAKLPRGMVFNQQAAYIPAYNNTRAWSVTETDSLAIPGYKNLAFSIGTLDTYLNNPGPALPPPDRNSFQFTFGVTYLIKSKY
ncbi:MAG: DUF481 domain-containing protein [Acidobacteriaceae bacterium]|nr:DUF481 domain-containing protein [Acidobacteriaceae bacterium]